MAKDSILDIKKILNEYSDEVQEDIIDCAENVAKKGANKLKQTSPRKTGEYASGWRVKTTKQKGEVSCVIYNAKKWQLTHLLEKSHLLRNGKSSTPIVHIAPVEQQCIKEYESEVENIIKNGG